MAIIYALAAAQALFLVSLLVNKREKSTADLVLAAWLCAIAFHTLVYFFYFQFSWSIPVIMNLNATFPFVQGPLLLAYVAALVGRRDRFTAVDYLHLVPAAGFFVYLLISQGIGVIAVTGGEHSRNVSIFSVNEVVSIALLASVPIYIALSLQLMFRARQALDSPVMPTRFRWIWFFVAGLGLIWVLSVISFWLNQSQSHSSPGHLVFWALTLFVYGLGYMGLTRTSVFSKPDLETLRLKLQPKYRKSGLGPDEARQQHARLIRLMDTEQLYLDSDLSLKSLADEMEISANHLSQVINVFEECNFHDFINRRRVEAACKRLDDSPQSNLLELAMDVGFNSKSSFNRAFLRHTGKNPTQYLQESHLAK